MDYQFCCVAKLHITYLVTIYSLEKELDLCKHYQGIELIRLNWTI